MATIVENSVKEKLTKARDSGFNESESHNGLNEEILLTVLL